MFTCGVLLMTNLAAASAASAIETAIAERLKSFRGSMGVFAVHLGTGETIAVHADTRFPTASLIKTAVMVEVFARLESRRLEHGQLVPLTDAIKVGGSGVLHSLRDGRTWSVDDLLFLMIALSDNTATNMLVGLTGTQAVNDRMAAMGLQQTRLYRPTFRGGHADAWPAEEKEFGLGSSTPREMATLMERIARGQAVSPEASRQMEALLGKQQIHEVLCRLLPGSGDGVTVAHKTGQDEEKLPDGNGAPGSVRTDAGIVTTPKGRYAIAIFARRAADMRWTVDNEALVAGAEVSRLVFEHFTR
jgi:beta-lactamase class A